MKLIVLIIIVGGLATVHAGLGRFVENLMGGTCQYSACKEELAFYQHQHERMNERAEQITRLNNLGKEHYNVCKQDIDSFNAVIEVIREIHVLLGVDYKYYYYVNGFGAMRYKYVSDHLQMDNMWLCQDTNFHSIFGKEANKDFLEEMKMYLGVAQETIQYVKEHLEEERSRVRKIPLYNQIADTLKKIDVLLNGDPDGDDSKYYYYIDSGYGPINYKIVIDNTKEASKNNLNFYEDLSVVKELQKDFELIQSILIYVQENQAQEKELIDEFKKKVLGPNQYKKPNN
jgi:hypothetical protein